MYQQLEGLKAERILSHSWRPKVWGGVLASGVGGLFWCCFAMVSLCLSFPMAGAQTTLLPHLSSSYPHRTQPPCLHVQFTSMLLWAYISATQPLSAGWLWVQFHRPTFTCSPFVLFYSVLIFESKEEVAQKVRENADLDTKLTRLWQHWSNLS